MRFLLGLSSRQVNRFLNPIRGINLGQMCRLSLTSAQSLCWISLLFFGLGADGWTGRGLLWAKNAPQTSIQVSLLGQPCLLQGPLDANTLKRIHSIGPAQLYPISASVDGSVDSAQALAESKRALSLIRTQSSLPSLLDQYREKLGKRLEAQIAFYAEVEAYKKTRRIQGLQELAQKYLSKRLFQQFEGVLKKRSTLLTPSRSSSIAQGSVGWSDPIEELWEIFQEGIEPDPEHDFHRAIKKLDVQYACSFEEVDSDE